MLATASVFLPQPGSTKNVQAFLSDTGFGGKPFQALSHLQRVIRKLPELDPPIESLLPRRT
jgi:hypothetical protein